jgi:spermidine synthase
MVPRQLVERVTIAKGRELALYRRGDDFVIQVGINELMSSRAHGSEDALAQLGLAAPGYPVTRILVCGLGMGFTLRAVLDRLGDRPAEVVVAELLPTVVAWNRTWLGHLAGHPLTDPRVQVREIDCTDCLVASARYDVILLDVDNGPEAFTVESNSRLYDRGGIARLRAALVPGGAVAVWSASQDPRFAQRLAGGGFEVSVHGVAARPGGKGGRHTVFVGRSRVV